jgi:hypothetical protein
MSARRRLASAAHCCLSRLRLRAHLPLDHFPRCQGCAVTYPLRWQNRCSCDASRQPAFRLGGERRAARNPARFTWAKNRRDTSGRNGFLEIHQCITLDQPALALGMLANANAVSVGLIPIRPPSSPASMASAVMPRMSTLEAIYSHQASSCSALSLRCASAVQSVAAQFGAPRSVPP